MRSLAELMRYIMRGCEHGGDMEDWVQATKELTDEPAGKSNETNAA
jgi:hypothetical protein